MVQLQAFSAANADLHEGDFSLNKSLTRLRKTPWKLKCVHVGIYKA